MAEQKAYDPSKTTLILGALSPTGYAPDTKIVISRTNGLATPTVGVDNDLVVNINPQTQGTLTLSLMHTSSFNAVIYSWLQLVRQTGNPYLPVSFVDPSGQKIDTVGWFETQGDYTNAQETSTIEWTIGLADATLRPYETGGVLGAIQAYTGGTINSLI